PMAAGAPYTLLAGLVRRVAGLRDDLSQSDRQYRLARSVAASAGESDRAGRIVLALGAMLGEPWVDADPALAAARQAGAALAPLSSKAAGAFVDEVLPSCSPERREALIAHAGGSPFLLEELLRAAATSTSREQPVAAIAIVQARLDRLSPDLRRVLRAASVF